MKKVITENMKSGMSMRATVAMITETMTIMEEIIIEALV